MLAASFRPAHLRRGEDLHNGRAEDQNKEGEIAPIEMFPMVDDEQQSRGHE